MPADFGRSVLGIYCERGSDPSFWAEPLNAATNAAFLVSAILIIARSRGDRAVLALGCITLVIAVGSFAFHTLATFGAMLADIIPIMIFMIVYFYLALRRFIGLGPRRAAVATGAFVAAAAMLPTLFPPHEPWRGFGSYLGALMALCGVAANLSAQPGPSRQTGLAVFGVAGLFALAILFRTVDGAVCSHLHTGTHALWHVINAFVLYRLTMLLRDAPRI